MVSRRKFFSILIMMVVLFFMFQFAQVFKERGNNYDVNSYAEVVREAGGSEWKQSIDTLYDGNLEDNGFILFIGDENKQTAKTIKEWCLYKKKNFFTIDVFQNYDFATVKKPEIVFVSPESIDYSNDLTRLVRLTRGYDIPIVFCGLPDMDTLNKKQIVREILGLKDLTGLNEFIFRKNSLYKTTNEIQEVQIDGVYLYKDFLLGGEILYKLPDDIEEEKAEKIQDLDLVVPWYRLGPATKAYMVGIIDNDDLDKVDYPAIIWRNSYFDTQIYAVSGNYLDSASGFGIIDGIEHEIKDYYIYPVVNARNVYLSNYPALAAENEQKMLEIYSRSQNAVLRDVVWPGIDSMYNKDKIKITFFINPQYVYSDNIEPDISNLSFYMKQIKEIDGEAGWSLQYSNNQNSSNQNNNQSNDSSQNYYVSLWDKAQRDYVLINSMDDKYKFCAVYADSLTDELMENISNNVIGSSNYSDSVEFNTFKNVSSIITPYTGELPYLSYYTDNVTLQCTTAKADDYSYSKDLDTRGLITSIGYTSVYMDFTNVIWPEDEDDQWENYFEDTSSNISSYWNMYSGFERTAATESDSRIRNFLNLSYSISEIDNNKIKIETENVSDSWFVLRTHNKDIENAIGLTYEKLEDDVFLLHVLDENAEIQLKASKTSLQYEK